MGSGPCFIKAVLHVVNESEQRTIICNHLRLIPLDRVQTVFRLSPSLFSQPCRFRRTVKAASFPPGEAKGAGTDSPWCIPNGILRTAADPSGAMRRPPLSGEVACSLGSPVGELSSVSETEGVWFVEW